MARRLSTLISLVVAVGCGGVSNGNPQQAPAAVAEEIHSLMQAYVEAVVTGDWETATAFYADEPDFRVFATGTPLAYEETVAAVRGSAESRNGVEMDPFEIEVTVLSEDAAIAAFTLRQRVEDSSGLVSRYRGSASWVWVRRADGWKILHGSAVHLPESGE